MKFQKEMEIEGVLVGFLVLMDQVAKGNGKNRFCFGLNIWR